MESKEIIIGQGKYTTAEFQSLSASEKESYCNEMKKVASAYSSDDKDMIMQKLLEYTKLNEQGFLDMPYPVFSILVHKDPRLISNKYTYEEQHKLLREHGLTLFVSWHRQQILMVRDTLYKTLPDADTLPTFYISDKSSSSYVEGLDFDDMSENVRFAWFETGGGLSYLYGDGWNPTGSGKKNFDVTLTLQNLFQENIPLSCHISCEFDHGITNNDYSVVVELKRDIPPSVYIPQMFNGTAYLSKMRHTNGQYGFFFTGHGKTFYVYGFYLREPNDYTSAVIVDAAKFVFTDDIELIQRSADALRNRLPFVEHCIEQVRRGIFMEQGDEFSCCHPDKLPHVILPETCEVVENKRNIIRLGNCSFREELQNKDNVNRQYEWYLAG